MTYKCKKLDDRETVRIKIGLKLKPMPMGVYELGISEQLGVKKYPEDGSKGAKIMDQGAMGISHQGGRENPVA